MKPRIVDVMPAFWRFWDEVRDADAATRVRRFRERVLEPHREAYANFAGIPDDAELARYLTQVERLLPRMHAVGDTFLASFDHHLRTFVRTFPDMDWDGTVCFFPNFGVTDAGTGRVDGKIWLVFGMDTIAAQHGPGTDLTTLFHHELFHVHHDHLHAEWAGKNRSRGEIPLWWLLWCEGLATHVSRALNPHASLAQALLSPTLAPQAAPRLAPLAADLRRRLDTGDPAVVGDYLSASPRTPDIPPRAGYYVGLRVAERIGERRSLRALARLGGPPLRREVERVLTALEAGR